LTPFAVNTGMDEALLAKPQSLVPVECFIRRLIALAVRRAAPLRPTAM